MTRKPGRTKVTIRYRPYNSNIPSDNPENKGYYERLWHRLECEQNMPAQAWTQLMKVMSLTKEDLKTGGWKVKRVVIVPESAMIDIAEAALDSGLVPTKKLGLVGKLFKAVLGR